jgi:hypothetical protein
MPYGIEIQENELVAASTIKKESNYFSVDV